MIVVHSSGHGESGQCSLTGKAVVYHSAPTMIDTRTDLELMGWGYIEGLIGV